MFYILIVIYSLFAIKYRGHKLVLLFLTLQILSLSSAIVIQKEDYSDDPTTIMSAFISIVITLSIILPWENYTKITTIETLPKRKFDKLSTLLFIIGGFIFLILFIVALYVNVLISDINAFKYEDGSSMDFYYAMLPFDTRLFILAYSLYYLSFFFIPLHFYSLYIGDVKKAVIYFVLSLNLPLYGLTFFSRWTIALFILLYLSHWICYSRIVPDKLRKKEIKWMGIFIGSLMAVFVAITISRFTTDTSYEKEVVNRSGVDMPPTLYSIFDYLGQSNSVSLYHLNQYDGNTFGGSYLLTEAQNFFSVLRIVSPSNSKERIDKVWTEYQHSFRTYACYTIFDVGIIGAISLSILFVLLVRRRGKKISFNSFMRSSILLMVPCCSIFFSYLNIAFFTLVLFFFLKVYLRMIKTTK